jgi:hypothetical protein
MIKPEAEPDVPEEFLLEDGEVILAGIELHAHIVQENGHPKILFTYLPAVKGRKLPEEMIEFNSMIEMVCRKTVEVFPPVGFGRFYTVLKNSGGADRCWYRIKISLRDDEHDVTHGEITDWIDPELLLADPHVAHRGKKAKAIIRRLMKEFMSELLNEDEVGE